jgi:hypothetical protein
MKDAFDEVTRIWDRCVAGAQKNMEAEVLDLLKAQGIGIRQGDGELRQITLSKPTSVESAYVIGLRYIKSDGTQTEDLFLVEKGRPIVGCYKGSLEKRRPEYKGTHKQTVTFTLVAGEPPPTTSVNTISMVKGDK